MTATRTEHAAPAPVTTAGRGLRHEAAAVGVVWQRDLIRYSDDRGRILSALVQPLLFLFVLGKGLGATLGRDAISGAGYSTFLFPGVLATSVMFTAIFSAITIVWDREQGFLREMLVAPISRHSIVVGKCLGGATVATGQSLVLLALAGLVGVPYAPPLLLGCLVLVFVIAFGVTAFGLVLAVRVQQMSSVMPRVQLVLAPLMYLSGAFFPLTSALPTWLHALTLANPLSYGVEALRRVVLHWAGGNGTGDSAETRLHWGDWPVPLWLDVTVVVGAGALLLAVAAWLFTTDD